MGKPTGFIEFERELPRGDNGKLYKQALKARYWP